MVYYCWFTILHNNGHFLNRLRFAKIQVKVFIDFPFPSCSGAIQLLSPLVRELRTGVQIYMYLLTHDCLLYVNFRAW